MEDTNEIRFPPGAGWSIIGSMSNEIRFRMSDLREIAVAFAQITVACVALPAFLFVMLLTVPVGPAACAAIISALTIRSMDQWPRWTMATCPESRRHALIPDTPSR